MHVLHHIWYINDVSTPVGPVDAPKLMRFPLATVIESGILSKRSDQNYRLSRDEAGFEAVQSI